jgi:uncharacterized membrane protein
MEVLMSKNKSSKGKGSAKEKQAAKKAAVLDNRKSRLPLFVIIACVGLAVVAGIVYFQGAGEDPSAVASSSAVAAVDNVSHPLAPFEDGKARYFQYKTEDGSVIKYFVLKSSDGVMRAAFDACDVCWRAGKGYYQNGDVMVCRNCGQKFASVKVNEVKGGCNPAPLAREVVGDNLVIKVSDIKEGQRYFNFGSRS